jgi:hypothetical protein
MRLPAGRGVSDGVGERRVGTGVREGRGVADRKPVTVAVGVRVYVAVGVLVMVGGRGVSVAVAVGVEVADR